MEITEKVLSTEYCEAIQRLSELNSSRTILVAGKSREFVSGLMATRPQTDSIKIYGVLSWLSPWYECLIEKAVCPVEIIFDYTDGPLPLKEVISKKKPVSCWQRHVPGGKNERYFVLFGSNAFLFSTSYAKDLWVGNFNESHIRPLTECFQRYLKESGLCRISCD